MIDLPDIPNVFALIAFLAATFAGVVSLYITRTYDTRLALVEVQLKDAVITIDNQQREIDELRAENGRLRAALARYETRRGKL